MLLRSSIVRRLRTAAAIGLALVIVPPMIGGSALAGASVTPAVQRASLPQPPARSMPAVTGIPGAFRLAYSDPAAAAASADKYRVIVLNADAARHIATIRRNNPAAIVLVYKEASFTTTWDPTGISRGVGYTEASAHPEWTLTDTAHRPIESQGWPDNFLMDVGSPSYQQAWARNVAAELARADWDGVFVDDVNWRASFAGTAPARYPTDARWRAATRSFLAAVTPTIRSNGNLAILNIGEGHAAPGLWDDWLTMADGAMEEHFTNWSTTVGGPFVADWGSTGWRAQVAEMATAARMGKISMLRIGGVDGDVEAMRYGLASYHLMNDGRQTIAPPRFENPQTFPEQTWDLGAPLGAARPAATNVHRRDFTAGTAIVNTSSSAAATVELGGTFLDHAGRAITRITLGPTRGAILRRVGADAPVPTPRPPTTPAPTPGRDVLVSTLTPTAPARNDWGPYERDRANGEQDPGDGGGLRIGNVAYAKGLGVHATSDVRFRVPAGCRSFQAKVGIDDEVGAKGSVTFEVWSGTKKKLYVSPVRTGSQGPLAVTVPLTGVSELRLVVRDAGDGDAFDHADWADARFTCS